jgi:hypothetical protein
MHLRMRLLKGANALLYIGPLVAGMSGFGWGMVASFTLIFVVWLIVLRPEQWPATAEEWQTGIAWLAVLGMVLSQVVLICLLFGIGRGIGAAAGFLPVVNPQLPLTISFLAIPLCRMLWNAQDAADRGIFLDEEAEVANAPRAAAVATASIIPLLNHPDETSDAKVAADVADVLAATSAELRLKTLAAALAAPDRSHATLRRTLILWCTEPEIVAPGLIPNVMALAFAIADRNGDLLRLYVPRAMALIGAFPDRAADFPSPARLRDVAGDGPVSERFADLPAHLRADLSDGLHALAHAVERALAAGSRSGEARLGPLPQSTARIA